MMETQTKRETETQRAENDLFETRVARYREWLAAQSQQHRESIEQNMGEYAERAMHIVEVQESSIQTFAPFRYKYSALQTITLKQRVILIALALAWLAALAWNWRATLAATITAITLGYLGHLILDGYMSLSSTRHSAEEHIDEEIIEALSDADWPPYTILCPLYKEAQIVPQFVNAIRLMDYPADKLQILFLTESDDAETRKAILSLRLPSHFRVVTVPDGAPRTKPRACNYGLVEATGQYVVIYDAEDIPDPLQLKKAVLTFANHGPNLACVQARLNFYNPEQNLLTRWFTAEYSLWFDLVLPGLQQARLALPLGGTSNHFPAQTLRALGGWDAFNVTEDCDLGLRLSWFRLKTVIVDSTTYEEANSRVKNWIRQRSRWIKGYMQTYLVHMREPLHYLRYGRLREFFSLQVVIGGKTAVLLLNPIMWALLLASLFFGKTYLAAFTGLFPPFMLYVGGITLVLGNFFYWYSYLLGCMKREHYALVKWMLLIPIYWVLASVAASMALYELFTRPHYWQKTVHGLHLNAHNHLSGPANNAAEEDEWESVARLAEQLTPITGAPELLHGRGPTALAEKYDKFEYVPVPSVEDSIATMIAPRKAALLPSERARLERTRRTRRDNWLIATLVTACLLSIASFIYFARLHSLASPASSALLSSPAQDSLPLPQLMTALFSWNAELRSLGLTYTIPAILSYLATAIFIFLSIRLLTSKSMAGYLGALVFLLNPGMLYFQIAPLSALLATAALTMTLYHLLAWARSERLSSLIATAGSLGVATLCRYDAWLLYIVLLVFVAALGLVRRRPRARVVSNLLIFGIPGSLGMVAWAGWRWSVTGNPLAFVNSSRTYLLLASQVGKQLSPQLAWHWLQFLGQAAFDVLGPLAVLALLAALIFLARRARRADLFVLLAISIPGALSLLLLASSQSAALASTHLVPQAQLLLLRLRLGIEMIVPASILIGSLFGHSTKQPTQ